MKRLFFTLIFFISVLTFHIFPETSIEDTQPAAGVLYWGPVLWNTVVWGPQAVAGVDFVQVSPEVWQAHLSEPWVWDNDEFDMNQVGHPYQGALSYSTARGSGWGIFESLYSTAVSSISWELFMENESPSKNDFIVTTMGGVAVGEMFYRLSQRLNHSQNEEDFSIPGKILSWALSPGGNTAQLIYGEQADSKKSLKIDTITTAGASYICVNDIEEETDILHEDWNFSAYAGLDIDYGIPSDGDFENPYDLFFIDVDAGIHDTQFLVSIFSEGALWGRQVYINEQNIDFLGVFLHYDFILNQFLNLSANSLGAGWLHNDEHWETDIHLSFVAMGGTECPQLKIQDYLYGEPEEERRSYDLSCGANLKSNATLLFQEAGSITLNDSFYHLNIIPGSVPDGGSGGSVIVNYLSLDLRKTLTPDISIMLLASSYNKLSGYDILHDITESILECRIGVVIN